MSVSAWIAGVLTAGVLGGIGFTLLFATTSGSAFETATTCSSHGISSLDRADMGAPDATQTREVPAGERVDIRVPAEEARRAHYNIRFESNEPRAFDQHETARGQTTCEEDADGLVLLATFEARAPGTLTVERWRIV